MQHIAKALIINVLGYLLFEYGKCIAPVVSNVGAEIAVGNTLQLDHNRVLRFNLSIRTICYKPNSRFDYCDRN